MTYNVGSRMINRGLSWQGLIALDDLSVKSEWSRQDDQECPQTMEGAKYLLHSADDGMQLEYWLRGHHGILE